MSIAFPTNGLTNGQKYTPPGIPGTTYTYDATRRVWVGAGDSNYPAIAAILGGVKLGYTGSVGANGFTGSAGAGFTGSAGAGFTGSAGTNGFTGSAGTNGFTGSAGTNGFTGSAGAGFTGSAGTNGFTGSAGTNGFTGSAGAGFTGSAGAGFTGSTGYTGSIGLGSRTTATVTTATVANSASTTASITGFKGYNLYKVYSSDAAWIRIYTTVAARSSDSSRTQGTDPTPDVGIVAEVVTISAGQTITLAPAVLGFNDESPVSDIIPIAVTNLSGGSLAITVTLTLVQTEI
jgi:hypothetical protein